MRSATGDARPSRRTRCARATVRSIEVAVASRCAAAMNASASFVLSVDSACRSRAASLLRYLSCVTGPSWRPARTTPGSLWTAWSIGLVEHRGHPAPGRPTQPPLLVVGPQAAAAPQPHHGPPAEDDGKRRRQPLQLFGGEFRAQRLQHLADPLDP